MKSICTVGILSHQKVQRIQHKSVAMNEIQEKRKKVVVPDKKGNRPLHQYVNLYFHARNPMMFKRKAVHKELCVVRISKDILHFTGVVIADRNASSDYVRFSQAPNGLKMIDRELVFAEYWNHEDPIEKFRRASIKCAEALVPDKVSREYLLGAYVSCLESKKQLYNIIIDIKTDFDIKVDPDMFFL